MRPALPWIVSALALVGMWLVGRKCWAGWAAVLMSEALFVVESVWSNQWGYLLASAGFLVIYARNLAKWHD